ncbi:MAG: hypothetical protein U0441_23335 [Polyangiaceae bacterium]
MLNPLVPRITIELGGHRRTVPASALATRLAETDVHAAVTDLLFGGQSSLDDGEARGKGSEGVPGFPETNEEKASLSPFVPGEKGRGSREREEEASALAAHLADALADSHSLAFYQLVARSLPPEAIQDALTRALDLSPRDVRRSRAAYFTALVRPLLPARRSGASRHDF